MVNRLGLATSLTIAVTAIVILIIALIVLTIFGGAIGPVANIAEATNNCKIQGKQTCAATNTLPFNWGWNTIKVDSGMTSCQALVQCSRCGECVF